MDNQSYFEDDFYNEDDAPVEEVKKGKSVAALVLGILSIVAHIIPLPIINWIVSLVSVIVSKVLAKKSPDSGLKKGAKVTSTIGLVLCIIAAVVAVLVVIAGIVLAVLGVMGLASMAGGMAAIFPFLYEFLEEVLWELGLY